MDPGSDEQAVQRASAKQGLPTNAPELLFRPSLTLGALDRALIYRGQYLMRMNEALLTDYTVVADILGEARFEQLVSEYVQTYPSRSYTLNRLGDHFVKFMETVDWLPRKPFLLDMGRLEHAICQVFDEAEVPALGARALVENPPNNWNEARFETIPALRVLEFEYPVSAYFEAVMGDETRPSMAKKKSWVAVYRRNYKMYRLDMPRAAYLLLERLRSGASLELALDYVLTNVRGVRPDLMFLWFSRWMSEGIFTRIA